MLGKYDREGSEFVVCFFSVKGVIGLVACLLCSYSGGQDEETRDVAMVWRNT